MIDHLFRFNTEAAARTALPTWGELDEGGTWRWRGDCVMPFRIVTGNTAAIVDGETVQLPVYAAGFFIRVTLPEQNAALAALPGCFLAAEVDETAKAKAVSLALRRGYTLEQIRAFRIEPAWAGITAPNAV